MRQDIIENNHGSDPDLGAQFLTFPIGLSVWEEITAKRTF